MGSRQAWRAETAAGGAGGELTAQLESYLVVGAKQLVKVCGHALVRGERIELLLQRRLDVGVLGGRHGREEDVADVLPAVVAVHARRLVLLRLAERRPVRMLLCDLLGDLLGEQALRATSRRARVTLDRPAATQALQPAEARVRP
jgi:hypothetical protein